MKKSTVVERQAAIGARQLHAAKGGINVSVPLPITVPIIILEPEPNPWRADPEPSPW